MKLKLTGFKGIKSFGFRFTLTSEFFFSLLLGLIWSNSTLVNYLRIILIRMPYVSSYSEPIVTLIFIVACLFSLPYMAKHINLVSIVLCFSIGCVYLLNMIVYPNNLAVLEENLVPFLLQALPLIFVGASIDLKKHYSLLYCLSLVSVIATVIRLLANPINMIYGDMHSSYVFLPHVCMVLIVTFTKPNILNVAVSVVGVITAFAYGTRGPLLCLLFLVTMYVFIFKKIKGHLWFYAVFAVLCLSIVLFYENILQSLLYLIEQMGMSTRVIDRLLSGDFLTSASRGSIQARLLEAIENNWLGYGMAGDRAIVGTYAHNLLIELWVSFGVFGGTIIIGSLIFLIIKVLIQKSKSPNIENAVVLVLLSSTFIKLFMSSSYLREPLFFLLIGLLLVKCEKDDEIHRMVDT